MLLLDSEQLVTDSAHKVAIISSSNALQEKISQLLRSRGIENVDIIRQDFHSEKVVLNAEDTVGVIIDISDESDVNIITEYVNAVIPKQMWCCLVGHSDSISLAQKLMDKNILYFHSELQLNLMMDKITSSTLTVSQTRHTVKVCVLGCKGGVGSSFISAHLAHQISNYKKVPVLLAQGKNGTQDLDLLFNKKLQGDIVEYNQYLDIFSGNIERLPLSDTEKYNFIVYDQPIFNVDKDNFVDFFEYSNSFVLVVERSVNSLRIAKQFLDLCSRERGNGHLIRTFVCVSDSKLELSKQMAKADIETLLGYPVDAVIPFLRKSTAKDVLSVKLSRGTLRIFKKLAMRIIGVLSRQAMKERKSLFKAIFKKILSN
ncbi:AAA family ATPase [Phocoenobacter skyensis]|uniref:Pilus assembly protein n=1 Tax=Phocoenobacter skyensis TaxID=97481 RepID=A0A1H7X4T7_9PAST|nr:pilus assembly protein [Pasteurella skyensis]MDP8079600.1 pilus assembly protein [Pasteurella skyensis]MDP8085549.1 pilus assembly protein [Pasteurella skyensis]MDP8185603.1 pilus assembly protein [Pasteurella skyensis]QLB21920.1 pilus assembly protein [Pasteurella skyensis]SEM28882.1 pilus assembly protein CpaE [Pasteurella skyensis]